MWNKKRRFKSTKLHCEEEYRWRCYIYSSKGKFEDQELEKKWTVAPNVLYKKGDVFMEDDVVAYFNYLRKVHTVSVNSSFQCCDSQ